ncbi:anthranilate phosphoribosyltransferase [Nannocystis sp. SCPEA4]|uniref:anthranilate phosphoribosyltransferase n=1 Tax=Nannocystis sp. SCPEA4 TaxID=2996787 RepID=UPI002272018C|nr:anthranilate phosphoribosyltransferase [Nannocystis sp. SCPEA4]MCY1053483.1 anthranilate phosphoribosyltransferase [Nannocystis sp. SCPEA4]
MTEGAADGALRRGLARLVRGEAVGEDEALAIFREIVAGAADPAQIGGLLVGLSIRGETAAVIAGAVRAMREAVVAVPLREAGAIDTCGTGGSGVARRNVSTAVAIAAAACGARVAKHGNRGISSPCGSADVLAALGVDITAPPERVGKCVDEVGVGFMFAPNLHPAMRHASGPRKALGLRTLFNLVGPMCNPAGVRRQVIGVFDPGKVEAMAAALGALGSERVFVVHGFFAGAERPGIDDLSPEGGSTIAEWHRGALRTYTLRPGDAGLPEVPIAAIAGDDAAGNANALRGLLAGEPGAYRTSVQYSGALALLAAGDDGLETLPAKARAIGAALDDGRAAAVLDRLVAASRAALP